jgi:superfamily II DNA helicase RecQ
MPWSITDFAQASGRGGRGGETFNVVVMIEQEEVEKRIEQKSGDIDVQAMGAFLIGNRCRRALISSYLDGQEIGCRELDRVYCDRCREGEEV